MANVTKRAKKYLSDLHSAISTSRRLRKTPVKIKEKTLQAELRGVILNFMEKDFSKKPDPEKWALKSFYWRGQEGGFQISRESVFSSKSNPDFVILEPYKISIIYSVGNSASKIKHSLGQAIINRNSDEYQYCYVLFHETNKDKKIKKASQKGPKEKKIVEGLWKQGIFLRVI